MIRAPTGLPVWGSKSTPISWKMYAVIEVAWTFRPIPWSIYSRWPQYGTPGITPEPCLQPPPTPKVPFAPWYTIQPPPVRKSQALGFTQALTLSAVVVPTTRIIAPRTRPAATKGIASLVILSASLLVFLGPQILASVDLSLKQVRWLAKASQEWMSARPYLWRDLVLAGGRDELVAFRAGDGARVWSRQISGTVRGIGVTDAVLYVGTLKGRVFALAYR